MTEPTLNTDSLGGNVLYRGGKAKFRQIYTLICMIPGTDPLNPDKGININSYYYAFKDSTVLANLEREISDQIEKYTPYRPHRVQCGSKMVNKKYIISILISLRNSDESIVVVADGDQSDYEVFKAS